MLYLVKYTTEIGTKQNNIQRKFTRKLGENIRSAIKMTQPKGVNQQTTIKHNSNHIQIYTSGSLEEVLKRIPGINYFTLASEINITSFEQLIEEAYEYFKPLFRKPYTFGVKCKKTGNQNFSKKQVEIELGHQLIHYGSVNLDNPDINCYVEIRENTAYFYSEKIAGMGGTPLGIQGKGLTMLSGGIDSPVAAWQAYRMGIDQDFVFFDLGNDEQRKNAQEVFKVLKQGYGYGASSKLFILDFMPVIREILKAGRPFQNLILKYCFYQAAEQIASFHVAHLLITGESIGQVSTQTTFNLATLDKSTSMMVLRPLSTLTKEEIAKKAKTIETFDLAYKGHEMCAIASKKVSTASSLNRLLKELQPLNLGIIDEAVEQRTLVDLDANGRLAATESANQQNEKVATETNLDVTLDAADHVIDLRPANEQAILFPHATSQMSFSQVWQDYPHWDPTHRYFFVCSVGNSSKVIAHYMQQDGFMAGHLTGGVKNWAQEQEDEVAFD